MNTEELSVNDLSELHHDDDLSCYCKSAYQYRACTRVQCSPDRKVMGTDMHGGIPTDIYIHVHVYFVVLVSLSLYIFDIL